MALSPYDFDFGSRDRYASEGTYASTFNNRSKSLRGLATLGKQIGSLFDEPKAEALIVDTPPVEAAEPVTVQKKQVVIPTLPVANAATTTAPLPRNQGASANTIKTPYMQINNSAMA